MSNTDYKSTLRLPQTSFPMKANLAKREVDILKRWEEIGLYERLLETRKDAPRFVLHDGPPYANGEVHVGTALNKILKDFIVRSRAMMGYKTPFVPGWDCHGMPIELQVSRKLGAKARSMSKLELRKLCRAHAEKYINIQREDFSRLGVIADWPNPYLTFSPEYDAAEIAVLRDLVENGYVYRGLRPVHWCFDCRTALAEAEVEYHDHTSPSIYVAFPLNAKVTDPAALAADPAQGPLLAGAHAKGKLFAVIWTTTPWTLPANLGITLNGGFDYVALESGGNFYIVAARLAEAVEKDCGLVVTRRVALKTDALRALDGKDIFRHPFVPRDVKLMFGDHVTLDAGTGLVHTAPGHGYEDFVIGSNYGLEAFTPVDAGGRFTDAAGKYAGMRVFEANPAIVEDLRSSGALLHSADLTHSYPHCWRCKNPLIFRATEQWFLNVDHRGLRQRALAEIEKVEWIPKWSRDRIKNMMETRPDWCLSRQRAWGVPIPAVRCAKCSDVSLGPALLRRVEEIFAAEGSDAWYARPLGDFMPPGQTCAKCGADSFEKTEDILDVWFDSGCSHAAVLARRSQLSWPADLYIEGVDQHRGWFQVSLITATATRDAAPYRTVITNGLTLDELGRKMSKSLGNVENAADVVSRVGADVMRLVFASVDYAADMRVGEDLFSAVSESYRKLRNTCRYMLGNLYDFDPERDLVETSRMLEFDRFALLRLERLKQAARTGYQRYDFQAVYNALVNFAVVDLSSLYVEVARDRLYCSPGTSLERRSAQTAFYHTLEALVRILAPLIPYTADEIYSHMPGPRAPSVHLLELQPPQAQWADPELEERWKHLLAIRGAGLKLLETMRQAGAIGAPLEAEIQLGADPEADGALAATLDRYHQQLKELFLVSGVEVLPAGRAAELKKMADSGEAFSYDGAFGRVSSTPPLVLLGRRSDGKKCPRCWMYHHESSELDARCRAALEA
ncbi:MAG TPA: isoleucine--tRNA ligase [Candidatus Binataceae bacterium]|nr:isoleucine--tRNA ligase [Candidatus Binataceae bacterium]